ncbi:MAG: response regulator [Bacteroidetes bacterium]|nr:response regulator [Bacteroidota bacterium]
MEKRVFLLDDDNDEHEIFQSALQRIDTLLDFKAASDWHAASLLLDHYQPDFIFVDLNMPKMDGFSCVAEIRKMPRLGNVPIYIYSTGISEKDGKKALAIGATNYIVKPASFLDLCKTLVKIFKPN